MARVERRGADRRPADRVHLAGERPRRRRASPVGETPPGRTTAVASATMAQLKRCARPGWDVLSDSIHGLLLLNKNAQLTTSWAVHTLRLPINREAAQVL